MIARLMALIAAALVAGCSGIPQDDRYQTHDGGRSNTRAEAPADYTAFITAHRSALRSKPMPGASGIATRPSTTGQSSAKPPNGAKTCG